MDSVEWMRESLHPYFMLLLFSSSREFTAPEIPTFTMFTFSSVVKHCVEIVKPLSTNTKLPLVIYYQVTEKGSKPYLIQAAWFKYMTLLHKRKPYRHYNEKP